LDEFSGNENLLKILKKIYENLREVEKKISDIAAKKEAAEREKDYLNHIVQELESAELKADEENELIAKKLEKLVLKKNFEIIVGLFEILSILSESKDISYVNNEVYNPINDQIKSDKISDVFDYIKDNFNHDISLIEIAKIAHLTPTSFCRMFKIKTKKSFVEYLNEIRVSNACKLLLETEMGISEIAYACGYKTASNFNINTHRHFQLFKEQAFNLFHKNENHNKPSPFI
jgi:AraC-like DNA-binding protein